MIVIGENTTFQGPEQTLFSNGVELVQMENEECMEMMQQFIRQNPILWNEDIGV